MCLIYVPVKGCIDFYTNCVLTLLKVGFFHIKGLTVGKKMTCATNSLDNSVLN